ncbi:MAG: DUF3300 domain-containing protein [Verrucomicrobiia bacterium]
MKARKFQKTLVVAAVGCLALLAVNVPSQDSTATTAAPQLPYGVSQIVKLAQGNVSDDTIVAYIKSTGNSYNLNTAQILYLRQQGVSDAVITTLLNQPQPGVATATVPTLATPAPPPAASTASVQPTGPPLAPAYQPLSNRQLDQLLGPIALYPDPLLAQILPASTLPTQIVLADRYVTGGGDANQIGQQPWDGSVQALAHYPNVLKYMDDNLYWTTEVGQAFLNQQQDVMDSIQRLRAWAQNLGNLQSTPQQQVVNDGGDIEILPAEPQVVYVPVYQPDEVYYQSDFGAPFITFGIGFPLGGWLNCDFDWHHHYLIAWNRDHPRPADWWHERPAQRAATITSHTTVWHSVNHPGFITANRSDRGWNNPFVRSTAPVVNRLAWVPVQQTALPSRPVSNGAFIGIQSSHETRTFSERGERSMETITRSAPVSRPATSFSSGGGGGGGGSHGKR